MAISNLIVELRTYLVANVPGMTTANLKLGRLPSSTSNQLITALRNTGSASASHTTVDRALVGGVPVGPAEARFADSTVQVLTRSARYEQGHDIQHRIYQVLHGRDFTLATLEVQGCEAFQEPQVVEEGDVPRQDRPFVWATNYALLVRNLSTV